MVSIKVRLLPYKKNKKGEHPIVIQLIHNRKRSIISIGHYLLPKQWDPEDQNAIEKAKTKDELLYLKKLNILIAEKVNSVKKIIVDLEQIGKPFSIDEILDQVKEHRSITTVFIYGEIVSKKMLEAGRTGNSKYYVASLTAFKKFRNYKDLTFDELNYKMITRFEEHLQKQQCKINTIAAYMKVIRALCNGAIKEGLAKQEYYPFSKYKIKHEKTTKRAIIKGSISEMRQLDFSNRPELELARNIFLFSFYCRGMSFVDIANLQAKNIIGERLYYSRNKTNQKFTIRLTEPMLEIIKKYNNLDDPNSYVFPMITNIEGDTYLQYQNAMRLTNKKLKIIGKMLGLSIPLTTYVSRHSWATIAKRQGIPTAIISEGLGHETEHTTQIYLDSFENDVLDDANDLITDI
ncbi:MAG: site-specific integrase [Prolixibacteraceae bacterium]